MLQLAVNATRSRTRLRWAPARVQPVQESARAAARRQLARHRQRAAVLFFEDRLHERPLGTPPHQLVRAAALAHEQSHGLGQQRLPGARLSGDDVEAGRELEPRFGDQHEILDDELCEHALS